MGVSEGQGWQGLSTHNILLSSLYLTRKFNSFKRSIEGREKQALLPSQPSTLLSKGRAVTESLCRFLCSPGPGARRTLPPSPQSCGGARAERRLQSCSTVAAPCVRDAAALGREYRPVRALCRSGSGRQRGQARGPAGGRGGAVRGSPDGEPRPWGVRTLSYPVQSNSREKDAKGTGCLRWVPQREGRRLGLRQEDSEHVRNFSF